MPAEIFSAVAGGNINVSTFVKVSTAADNTVLACGSNDPVIGVSTDAAKAAPISGASSTLAAASGDPIMINPLGSVCILTIGSGGCTRGDELISDSSGNGVTRGSSSLQNVGAIALESAAASELCRVMVWRMPWTPS
jgi:hypothetical protein